MHWPLFPAVIEAGVRAERLVHGMGMQCAVSRVALILAALLHDALVYMQMLTCHRPGASEVRQSRAVV